MLVEELIQKIQNPEDGHAYAYSDQLARIGGEYVLDEMVKLLAHEHDEVKYLAARTLGKIPNNAKAYDALLEAITSKENKNCSGGLAEALEGFDCSDKFVDIFKLYLFGTLKTSAMAKMKLDYEEFDITPRVIRKAEKHWKHYINNVKQDEQFAVMQAEVEELLEDLKAMFDGEENSYSF